MPNLRVLTTRRVGIAMLVTASVVTSIVTRVATAQSYPAKPVRVIVAYPPGQGTDIATRHMSEQLGRALGQNFIVENRPGAGGNVGTEATARSAPDGYTLTMGTTATHAANQFMYASVGYDPEKDFEPIALIGSLPMVISVHPSFAATNIQQLIAAAKAKPDTINVALTSTTARVVFELLRLQGGAPLFGVPYRGSAPAMTDVLGGQVPLTIDTVTATRPQVNAGRLRALAITTLKTSELLPGVPSVAEQGLPGFEITAWNALFAPRGTPPAVINQLNAEVVKALAQPETRQRLIQIGFEPAGPLTPQQLGDFVRAERRKWGDIIRTAQIKAE